MTDPQYTKAEIDPDVRSGVVVFNEYGTRFIVNLAKVLQLLNGERVPRGNAQGCDETWRAGVSKIRDIAIEQEATIIEQACTDLMLSLPVPSEFHSGQMSALIGGTAFCGHGVMASICEKCNPWVRVGNEDPPLKWLLETLRRIAKDDPEPLILDPNDHLCSLAADLIEHTARSGALASQHSPGDAVDMESTCDNCGAFAMRFEATDIENQKLRMGAAEIAFAVGWTDLKGKSVLEMVKDLRSAVERVDTILQSTGMQATVQQAIMRHPHYDGGATSAYGFAGSALKAVRAALASTERGEDSSGENEVNEAAALGRLIPGVTDGCV